MMTPRSISPFERFGQFVPASDAELTQHTVVAGETLSGLAQRYYGDWREWRVIADRNQVLDPRALAPGIRLLIPQRPLETGILERY